MMRWPPTHILGTLVHAYLGASSKCYRAVIIESVKCGGATRDGLPVLVACERGNRPELKEHSGGNSA
jgi:hypothetical protein